MILPIFQTEARYARQAVQSEPVNKSTLGLANMGQGGKNRRNEPGGSHVRRNAVRSARAGSPEASAANASRGRTALSGGPGPGGVGASESGCVSTAGTRC